MCPSAESRYSLTTILIHPWLAHSTPFKDLALCFGWLDCIPAHKFPSRRKIYPASPCSDGEILDVQHIDLIV